MLTAREAFLARNLERNKIARNMKKFTSLIATPQDLGDGNLILPANARLAISCAGAVEAGELRLAVNGDSYSTPDLVANRIWRLDYIRQGSSVTLENDTLEIATLYVLDEWQRPFAIATLPIQYEDEAEAFFAVAGSLSDERKALINALIRGHKDDGDWTKFSRYHIGANANETAGLTCLKTLTLLTKHNSFDPSFPVTFTVDRGFTGHNGGDGPASSYLLSNYDPAADSNSDDDSFHLGFYCTASRTTTAGGVAVYGSDGSNDLGMYLKLGLGNEGLYSRVNGSTLYIGPTTGDIAGHSIVGIRPTGPTHYASKNGAAATTNAATVVGRPSLPSGGLGILSSNPPAGFAPDERFGVFHAGSHLDDAAIARVAARINTYMAAVGADMY